MPIAPEFRPLYGHYWRTVIRPRILKRAGGRCEFCGRPVIRFEVAHLDGDPRNRADDNLAALCTGCHKVHDFVTWSRKALETRRSRKDRGRPLLGES